MSSLTDAFNDEEYVTEKQNDNVLVVRYSISGYDTVLAYDFLARVMIARLDGSSEHMNVTPFSQLDRDTLVAMHDKLVELDGHPPALPAESSQPQRPRGLNP